MEGFEIVEPGRYIPSTPTRSYPAFPIDYEESTNLEQMSSHKRDIMITQDHDTKGFKFGEYTVSSNGEHVSVMNRDGLSKHCYERYELLKYSTATPESTSKYDSMTSEERDRFVSETVNKIIKLIYLKERDEDETIKRRRNELKQLFLCERANIFAGWICHDEDDKKVLFEQLIHNKSMIEKEIREYQRSKESRPTSRESRPTEHYSVPDWQEIPSTPVSQATTVELSTQQNFDLQRMQIETLQTQVSELVDELGERMKEIKKLQKSGEERLAMIMRIKECMNQGIRCDINEDPTAERRRKVLEVVATALESDDDDMFIKRKKL